MKGMDINKIQWVDEKEEVLYEQDLTKCGCNLDEIGHIYFTPYPVINVEGEHKLTDSAVNYLNEELKKKIKRIRLVTDRVPKEGETAPKYSL